MVKCSICEKEVDDLDDHMLICENAYISKEYEDLIPCEICNTLVNFEDYNDHINQCRNPLHSLFPSINQNDLSNFFTSLLNNQQNQNIQFNIQFPNPIFNNQHNNENNEDEEDEVNEFQENSEDEENIEVNEFQENIEVNEFQENSEVNEFQENSEVNEFQGLFNFNNLENLNNFVRFSMIPNDPDILNILNEEHDEYEELTELSNNIGHVNIGIKNKELFIEDKNDKLITCPICVSDHTNYCITKCNHEFCKDCLYEWLESNNNCPICNYEFIEK